MGLLFSRKKSLTKKEVLEGLENDIRQLTDKRQRNIYKEKSFIGYLLILSFIFYLLGALVFYLYYSPQSWLEYGLYSIPLVLFPIIVYLVKKLLNMYFAHKKAQYDQELTTLRAEKRKVLNEVMESETFNVARELLQRFDPGNPILRQSRQQDNPPRASRRQTNGGTELRQRRQPHTPHPALRAQPHPLLVTAPQTVPRATQSRPLPAPQPAPPPPAANPSPSTPTRDVASQQPQAVSPPAPGPQIPSHHTNPGPQIPSHHTNQFIPPGMCLGPAPGPPTPSPILPRDRTSLDKMVEYLVGDGPNNRYALICSSCHSHNGMALGDEFEYITFRCAYCYTLNPARRGKPPLLRRTSTSAGDVVSTTDSAAPPAVAGATAAGEVSMETHGNEGNEETNQQGAVAAAEVTVDEPPVEITGDATDPPAGDSLGEPGD